MHTLSGIQPYQGIDEVIVGNGNRLHILHIGAKFFKLLSMIARKKKKKKSMNKQELGNFFLGHLLLRGVKLG